MRWVLAFAAMVCASPGFALTGREVWQNWQKAQPFFGWFIVHSTVEDLADGVRVKELMFTQKGGASVTFSDVTLTDGPDGEVKIAIGRKIDLYEPGVTTATLTVEASGAVLLLSDNDTGTALGVVADALTLIIPQGKGSDPSAWVNLNAVAGKFALKRADSGGMIPVDAALNVAEVDYVLTNRDPARDVDVMDGTIPALDFTLQAMMPQEMQAADDLPTDQAFDLGFAFEMVLKNGPVDMRVLADAKAPGQDYVNLTGFACTLAVGMDKRRFSVRDDCADGRAQVQGVAFPVEGALGSGKLLMQVTGPVNSMAQAENLNFVASLQEFTLNDVLWAEADPKGVLPRDAMNLSLDFGMLARWNIFDEASTRNFEPEALDLRRFDLNMAGVVASFSGHGTVDPEGGDSAPFKEGVLDGRISGLNRLLNAVVQAGFVAAGDLFPVRAGLAMVFKAGAGEDEMTTHVEVGPGGSVFVNGVQMN